MVDIESIPTWAGGDKYLTFDTDSFMVGDRVWVNGVRPGYIQYIGETSFAHGEWAGVVLDSPTGKNDGSFGGRRYFYCEPNRGIFCRLWRLTRYPLVTSKFEDRYSPILRSSSVDRKNNKLVTTTTFSRAGSPTRSLSSTSSRDSLGRPKKTVTVTTTTTSLDGYPVSSGSLRVGDRVYVSTSKGLLSGRLRFMGHADFATGYWAGIELDEPLGKNDGSVGGRRYFWAPNHYGLFAPAWKVSKADPGRLTTFTRTIRNSPEI